MSSALHIFGIRHHGPGSARSLKAALENLAPDIVLVEGPPDAAGVLPLLAHEEMQPPVALLLYAPGAPQDAVYYPFAEFSPEWQALRYALQNDCPVRFMDLPQTHQIQQRKEKPGGADEQESTPDAIEPSTPEAGALAAEEEKPAQFNPRCDPLRWLAEAAGYGDSERWWEDMVEHRGDDAQLFAAILEAMTALREEIERHENEWQPSTPNAFAQAEHTREKQREAWMRQTIRAAQREGFERIAVVCGAWHGPALASTLPEDAQAKTDAEILKSLPKTEVRATWVPWTYGRLTFASGYGAGIESPGWYHHLWHAPDDPGVRWMARVASLLRENDLDASSAHVIEAVRLAESLAALRARPLPGLAEFNEATLSILCGGNIAPLKLIQDKLIVGERLGEVPEETPAVPLQQDLAREQKRLRFPPDATQKVLDFDLRKPNDMERSRLLHRLNLLGIRWGEIERSGGGKGTFHEVWRVQWQPEFAVRLIEASLWGNSVREAATEYSRREAEAAPGLPPLTKLLDRVLLADLPEAAERVMARVENVAAVASDVTQLMDALPPLANILRYGDVRGTDTRLVGHIVDGLVTRICIGLVPACSALSDEAAEEMFKRISAAHQAIALLQNSTHTASWHAALLRLADAPKLHGLIAGRSCRLLFDADALATDEVARRLSLALSVGNDPASASAWVEGFLTGSGQFLLHDDRLWGVLDVWVSGLSADVFMQLLPLLRRTFSTFAPPERRRMGERVLQTSPDAAPVASTAQNETDFDHAKAERALPVIAQLLGLRLGDAHREYSNG
jgi:hypothetical protein